MRNTMIIMVIAVIAAAAPSCMPKQAVNQAALKLESDWKATNDRILETEGQRTFTVTKQQGFQAALLSARRLGMVVESESFDSGLILMVAPAPVPLTMTEWQEVQTSDTREMRDIVGEDLGPYKWLVTLDPSGKEVLTNVFVTEKQNGLSVAIGLGLRLKDTTSDRLRRMQPPPTAVHMGLAKFWAAFDTELAAITGKKEAVAMTPAPAPLPQATPSVTSARNPDAVAVIIGNKNYRGKIPPVEFAINDAMAFKQFAIGVLGLQESNVIELNDASLNDMESILGNGRSHMGKLWRWVRPGESDLFVFYSGHGVPGMKDRRAYLLPVEANPDMAEIQGYPLELMYHNLERMDARSVTVFVDACFSGESPGGQLVREASGIRVAPKAETSPAAITVITAAKEDQLASWDVDAQHGLFTKYLLEGLGGLADQQRFGNENSQVTLGELKAYLDREMTYAARRRYGRPQEAMTFGDPMKVIVTLGRNPPP